MGLSEQFQAVDHVDLQLFTGGQGEPVLVLHDQEYPVHGDHPFLQQLAANHRVLAPAHPGFGRSSLPEGVDTIEDFAYLYLDLLRQMDQAVHLVGMGIGGWVAAEMAVRCTRHLRSLTLVGAVGIKVGDRTERDILDNFVIGPEELLQATWHDPEAARQVMRVPGVGNLGEDELIELLRGRQTAALVTWRPFMHNPKLRARLSRIDIPTLVLWGETDRVVRTDYARAYAAAIPGAELRLIPRAGHYPYLERPAEFMEAIEAFLQALPTGGRNATAV